MTRTFDFIVNVDAHAVHQAGLEAVEKTLNETFGPEMGAIVSGKGADMPQLVRGWLAAHAGSSRIPVIVGGDGTLLTASAEAMKHNVALGVLPGGTQNFVARMIGLPADFAAAAKAYKNPLAVRDIDVGKVNGKPFLYGLLLDPASVDLFRAREKMRHGFSMAGMRNALDFATGLTANDPTVLSVKSDNSTEQGRLVAVTVNAMAPRPNRIGDAKKGMLHVFGNAFAKTEEADGQLVLYTHPGGFLRLTGMVPKLWNGTWADDSALKSRKGTNFELDSKDREIPVILDGEIVQAQFPMRVEIMPKALKLYQPK
jgi:diacylglycerol kinase family enzyme